MRGTAIRGGALRLLCASVLLWPLVVVTPVLAALTAFGNPVDPHGFPAFYRDGNGLALEPCLPPPAGYATREDLCIFDPVDPENPDSINLGVGGEIFWWMGEADAPLLPGVTKGKTLLTLALEGAFAAGDPQDGGQMSFGRVRIRVDVPVPGTYTVIHPYGTQVFENVTVEDGINFTGDIGSINILNPPLAFPGALLSKIGPFLTWPNYATNTDLQVLELDELGQPTGVVLEQYVGNPAVASPVVGGPNGNVFRVEGPGGISTETNLFTIMGKVYDPTVDPPRTVHVFPDAPPQNLFAVGPVNRAGDVGALTPQQPEGVRTGTEFFRYPKGIPLWYQENAGTVEIPEGGLKLTLCPGGDVMCISEPVDPADPGSVALRMGGEGFWWSAEAFIDEDTADVDDLPAGLDGQLTLAMEAAFGGDESIVDGNQVGFGRLRIRVDVPVAGDYTITHPYGEIVYENVTVEDGINDTQDIMATNPLDSDNAFIGALYSHIGPTFLTWPEFDNRDPLFLAANPEYEPLQRPVNPNDPESPLIQFVGDPAAAHQVTGGPNGNFFRIQGPDGIDVQTGLFAVTGKVFDPATFDAIPFGPFRIGTYRQGAWFLDNGSGTWDGPQVDTIFASFGVPTDIAVSGDWNGDGRTEVGTFRQGAWFLDDGNGAWDGPAVDTVIANFGAATDKPVVGDVDGDGISEIGVYRPASGQWFFDLDNDGWTGCQANGGADLCLAQFGAPGDIPVAGDWDGDGTSEVGVYRAGTWYLDANGNGLWNPGVDRALPNFGAPGDIPVTGDWDGDGSTQVGTYRRGTWYLDNGNGQWDAGVDTVYSNFGAAGDTPVSGRW